MTEQESFEMGSQVTDGIRLGAIAFLEDEEVLATIIIDREFKGLIPPLSEREFRQLEENLKTEGVLSPLVLWKGHNILLDGHNRHEICQKHNIPFKTVEIELESRDDVQLWLITNQLGRRNLLPEQVSYLRGKRYNLEKTAGHGAKSPFSQAADQNDPQNNSVKSADQNDPQNNSVKSADQNDPQNDSVKSESNFEQKLTTAERLAKEYKVGSGSIKRDGQYAQALDKLAQALGQEVKQDILTRQTKITKSILIDLAEIAEHNPSKARETLTMLSQSPQELKTAHHLQFSPGCLVKMQLPDNDKLHQRLARAGKVTPQRIEVWHRDMETMQMRKYLLKFEQVEFVPLETQPDIKELSDRLNTLREKPLDPFERDLVELLDRCTVLTPIEMEYLGIIERRY